ncbi:MAG: OprO/OprP family phosphate-selective porin [Gammaproteobacteria bacterium]|nr:OprO/OprP family phosphate-selective porin [Gammaproteobacteria bacterium]MCW8986986.1 OprO/OprP family phosphate-selective porin [Gammaproteobacteria bacterium]MCW9031748.1 OprO/OprP family phosphate-selective porin [Gammaproteobacteria bacterium]
MKNYKKVALAATVTAMLGGFASTANAVNWLMLQGTERDGQAPRAKVWGFLQPTYQNDTSKSTAAEPTRIGPNLEKQSQFQLQRARIGVRGLAMPLDSNVNYFFLAEFGQNAITDGGIYGQKEAVKLTDASVTLNHIPGARIRMGLFKTPGPEEIFQGVITFDYINMTDVSNQMMMERFPNGVNPTCTGATGTIPGCASGGGTIAANEASWGSFGAARDIGIQVFDSFKSNGWDHSYAVMLGNGNGLDTGGIADADETYLYWSSEKMMEGGKGPWAHGLKMFVWSHAGKRKVDLSDDDTINPVSHDRTRAGIGARYRSGNWRIAGEYMKGKGMIFQGPEKPNMGIGALAATQDLDGEADGYYLDVGYYVPGTKWELDARYDVYNRSTTHDLLTAEFNTLTLGVQYHLNRKARLTLNYATRDASAKDPISTASVPLTNMTTALHSGLSGIEDRISLQATILF